MYSYLLSPLILQVENPRQVFRPTLSSQATVGFGLPSMLRPKIDKQRLWPGAACYPSSSSRVTVGFTSACAGSQTPSGSGQHVQAARLRVATQKLVCQSSQQIAVENWRSLPKESMSASLVSKLWGCLHAYLAKTGLCFDDPGIRQQPFQACSAAPCC